MKTRKITKNILFSVLSVVMLFSAVGCNFGTGASSSSSSSSSSQGGKEPIQTTDNMLIENGVSDYVIVYPAEGSSHTDMQLAITEMQSLVMEATGYYIPAVSDAQETSSDKILSIGETAQAKKEQALMNKVKTSDLGSQGYVIDTIGTSCYMLGRSATANLYSVYEFLEYQFGFECYARDEYALDKNVKNRALLDFDLVDIPDFESRTPMNWEGLSCDRLRAQVYTEGFNAVGGNQFVHNVNALIPGSKYYAEHPKWFYKWTADGHTTQELCMTAHGDQAEWEALVDAFAYEMQWRLLEDPTIDWISFCQEDTAALCDCYDCNKDNNLYDTGRPTAYLANYIRMANAIAKKMKVWNEEVCPERNIIIFLWDYGKAKTVPVKLNPDGTPYKDENGNYAPYSEELTLEENIAVFYCSYSAGMYLSPTEDSNAAEHESLLRIQAIARNPLMYFWTYSANFSDYMMPFNLLDNRQELYQYMKQYGAVGVFDQAQFDQETAPDFGALKSYVSAKLMWDVDANVDELINNFMDNYYKEAAPIMKKMLNEYRAYFLYLHEEFGFKGGIGDLNNLFKTTTHWPYMRIQRFLDYIDMAYNEIEPLKTTDPERYQTLYTRIKRESLTWRYLELSIYPSTYDSATLEIMQSGLLADCIACGLTQCRENTSIQYLF